MTDEEIRKAARRSVYYSEDVEVDEDAEVRKMDDEEGVGPSPLGAWVAAWVWVPNG